MPKLPVLTGKTVINALEKIGFQAVRQKVSHVKCNMRMGG
ncbi:type II toxin-antitoxin system HicA family toxin [Nostoc sp. DSM 114159]|jgi:predicted RNA binding protein YcfA (HicA-like mRNA interferase family)